MNCISSLKSDKQGFGVTYNLNALVVFSFIFWYEIYVVQYNMYLVKDQQWSSGMTPSLPMTKKAQS